MTGSNPSITTTRLAKRKQITGINYRMAIQQFKHTPGSKNGRDAICSNGKTRVNLNSNYSRQILKSWLFFFYFYYRGICIIDNGASRRRTRNARFRARRADQLLLFKHSTKLNCLTNSAVQQL